MKLLTQRLRKFATMVLPVGVMIDSGWYWTPYTGKYLCSIDMIWLLLSLDVMMISLLSDCSSITQE